MKTFYPISFLFILFFCTPLTAQNRLQIIDPDEWWSPFGNPGRIEEATISLEPKGIYTEVGMYLTISDEGQSWPSGMELEIILDFNLPAGSIVHDSWLWMPDGEVIVKADVYDISKAIQTYEDIVDRNRDPSILYKKEASNYQIRIFPLFAGESRKIKISYLCPVEWGSDEISTWLPTKIFETGNLSLDHLKVVVVEDQDWKNPRLEGATNVHFASALDPVFGDVLIASLPGTQLNQPIKFAVDAPFDNKNYYISKLEADQENFYQLAYLPPPIANNKISRNYLFAVDYEAGNSNIEQQQLLEALFSEIKKSLDAEDNFNLVFSQNNSLSFLSEEWLPATQSNYEQHLTQLPILTSTSTISLIEEAIQFAKEKELQCDVVVVSNSNDIHIWDAQQVATDILEQIENDPITFHAIDYQELNFTINDFTWDAAFDFDSGNDRFYKSIANFTNGKSYSIFHGDFNIWSMLDHMLHSLSNAEVIYDMHVKMNQGFTYQRHNISPYQSPDMNHPLLQIGKYTGSFPMEIEFSAIADNQFVYEEEWINDSNVAEEDSLTREMWFGNQIKFLEGALNSNADISEIVSMSIDERVLSKYTAFLALDLENGGEPCANCWEVGNTVVINTIEIGETTYEISAAPNPFRHSTSITIRTNGQSNLELKSISIFDAFGKRVRLTTEEFFLSANGEWQWNWDGTGSMGQKLPPGVYYMVIETNQGPITEKLIIIE